MKAPNFIASRLRFKGRLATIAVTVSFFVMILSLAIAGGFRRELRSGISEISGDIMIGESEPAVSLDQQQLVQLREVRGVETVTPVIWKPGIVKGESDICGVLVKGVPMPDSIANGTQRRYIAIIDCRWFSANVEMRRPSPIDAPRKEISSAVSRAYELLNGTLNHSRAASNPTAS